MNTELFSQCWQLSKKQKISPSVLIRKFKIDWDLAIQIIEKIEEKKECTKYVKFTFPDRLKNENH